MVTTRSSSSPVTPSRAIWRSRRRADRASLGDRPDGTQRHRDAERARQFAARLVGRDVLGELTVDHQLLVEPARLAPGQDVRQQAERGVVLVEMRDRVPDHVQPVQLDPVLQRRARGSRPARSVGDPGAKRLGPPGNRAEVALGQRQGLVDVDIADQRQAGVGGNVEALEEGRDVLAARPIRGPP